LPPHTTILDRAHTAVGKTRAVGAPVVLVALQLLLAGLKTPPVLSEPEAPFPPQTITLEPVQTAACPKRATGAPDVVNVVQVFVAGS